MQERHTSLAGTDGERSAERVTYAFCRRARDAPDRHAARSRTADAAASCMARARLLRVAMAAVAVASMGVACAPRARPGPDVYGYTVEHATTDSTTIQRGPRVYFRGGFAYLVHDRWHYRTEEGWVVFVEEPEELRRQRGVETEQSATTVPSPRGPTIHQAPGAGAPLAMPPAGVR